jgi:purine-binding chemotaxis protein CheW
MQDLGALHLIFRLGSELFAVPVRQVREVALFAVPVPVPRAPDFVGGIINHHGRIVTLLDLPRFLRVHVEVRGKPTHLILLARDDLSLGIACDGVLRIAALSPEPWEPIVLAHEGPVRVVDLEASLSGLESFFG